LEPARACGWIGIRRSGTRDLAVGTGEAIKFGTARDFWGDVRSIACGAGKKADISRQISIQPQAVMGSKGLTAVA